MKFPKNRPKELSCLTIDGGPGHTSHVGQTALRVLRRRWMVVLGAIVVVAGLTVARGLSEPKLYVSSASLLFRDPGFDEKLFGTTFFAPSDDPEREAQTNIELVSLDVVAERTAAALGGDYEPEDVTDKIAIAGGGGSNVITVDASDTVAAESARIANTFAREYIEFRRDADRSKIQDAQVLVRSQLSQVSADGVGPAARTLRDRLDQLDVLASLQTGNAELVQEARPAATTSSPGVVGTAVRGLLLGLLLAGVLVLLIERLDRRLHDPEEAAAILGRPLLGAIAPARGKLRPGELSAKESEAFHMLRANLRYLSIDREIRFDRRNVRCAGRWQDDRGLEPRTCRCVRGNRRRARRGRSPQSGARSPRRPRICRPQRRFERGARRRGHARWRSGPFRGQTGIDRSGPGIGSAAGWRCATGSSRPRRVRAHAGSARRAPRLI